MLPRGRASLLLAAFAICIGVMALVLLRGCDGGKRLVEVFDNGPVGGPRGGWDGYRWVGAHDLPPPGSTWKTVDFESLTPEERARIR